jgi:hypothetical protein
MSKIDLQNNKRDKLHSDVVYRLNYSADLVEKIGSYIFSDGTTMRTKLTVEGISFWDFFTAELAHIHIPQVFLSEKNIKNALFELIKPELLKYKYKYKLQHLLSSKSGSGNHNFGPQEKNLLFLGYSNRMYADILFPLIKELKKDDRYSLTVLMDNKLQSLDAYSIDGCAYNFIWSDFGVDEFKRAKILNSKLQSAIKEIQIDNLLRDVLTKSDLKYYSEFKNLFDRLFRAYIPRVVNYVIATKYILKQQKPLIIISPDTADSRTRVFSFLANKYNVPSLDIQFGLAGEEAVEWRFLLSDKVAVWGDSSKEAILKQKISENKIVLTGSPRYDLLIQPDLKKILTKKKFLNIPSTAKIVLLASTYHFKKTNHADISVLKEMQISISEAIKKTDNIILIVKPHPHENVKETRAFFSKSKKIIFVNKDSDIRELIHLCDVFISYGSTTTIDALIAKKLIICPIFPGWSFSSDIFRDSGVSLNPVSKEEILSLFKSISDNSFLLIKEKLSFSRHLFLKNYIKNYNEPAAKNISELVYQMLKTTLPNKSI